MPALNDRAPDRALPGIQSGREGTFRLSQWSGRWVALGSALVGWGVGRMLEGLA